MSRVTAAPSSQRGRPVGLKKAARYSALPWVDGGPTEAGEGAEPAATAVAAPTQVPAWCG
jgi:hypothetical protein